MIQDLMLNPWAVLMFIGILCKTEVLSSNIHVSNLQSSFLKKDYPVAS